MSELKLSFWDRLRGRAELPQEAKSHVWSSSGSVPVEVIERIRFGGFSSAGQMYRNQPAVRTVTRFLSWNIGQLNPKVYNRAADEDRRQLNDHPLAVLLRKPNPKTSRFRMLRDTVSDIAIYDRAFWVKQRVGGQVERIVRVPPGDATWDENSETLRRNGVVIPRRNLVVFPGYVPYGSDLGVSPMETLKMVLAEEHAAVEHRRNMWNNGARQGQVIRRPLEAPEWGDEERKRFRADWQTAMTGAANSGKTAILEDGMLLDQFQAFNPRETEYIAGRRLTYEEVALAYGGTALADLIAGRQRGGEQMAESHTEVYQDVFGPWLRFLQDEIELQLLPDFINDDVYVEFDLQEKLKGSFEEQVSVAATSVGVPFVTINEQRARMNLPPMDGEEFDIPVQPLNVLYGGQQSTQEPTADPSTPPGLLSADPQVKQAPRGAVRRRADTASRFEKLFRDHFTHVEASLNAARGAKQRVDRWDGWTDKLNENLFLASVDVTGRTGRLAAEQIDGTYDVARTLPFLEERSRIAAEDVMASLRADVEESEDLEHTFAVAKGSTAVRVGLTTATGLIAFARTEAAKHTTDETGSKFEKTWVVTSGKSRHPEWDGMTTPVGEDFPNGAAWPGDPRLGTDQTAGCTCLLNIEPVS